MLKREVVRPTYNARKLPKTVMRFSRRVMVRERRGEERDRQLRDTRVALRINAQLRLALSFLFLLDVGLFPSNYYTDGFKMG